MGKDERKKNEQLESHEVPQLNEALAQFFFCRAGEGKWRRVRPDSLKVMEAALDGHLRSKSYLKSIVRDEEFMSTRKVLEGKGRKLHELGMWKRPNKSQSLTKEEEGILWEKSQLRDKTPRSLMNTVFEFSKI